MGFGNVSERRSAPPQVGVSVVILALGPKGDTGNSAADSGNAANSAHSRLWLPLVKRVRQPFLGCWALPGGDLRSDRSLEQSAYAALESTTDLHPRYLEQLYTFGGPTRSHGGLRQELGTLATTLPFFAYTACFLLAPTVIVIVGAFQDRSGNFTLANFNKMFEANTIAAFGTSILVSLASSLIGAVVGALASYALVIGAKPNGLLRRMVSAISSVLAQFGGVMLAFAFIATIGINGIGTMLIKTLTGYTVNPNWLSSLPGLVTIYCYFQIPLMIIIFLPAVDSIRPQWREACESLGGNTFQYWTRVACPILAPRFISAFLLLFASAFSAYATAAALFSQRSILVPLMIQGAMRNELDPNQQGFAQVLAFAMIIVVAIVMLLSHAVEKRAGRWQ